MQTLNINSKHILIEISTPFRAANLFIWLALLSVISKAYIVKTSNMMHVALLEIFT